MRNKMRNMFFSVAMILMLFANQSSIAFASTEVQNVEMSSEERGSELEDISVEISNMHEESLADIQEIISETLSETNSDINDQVILDELSKDENEIVTDLAEQNIEVEEEFKALVSDEAIEYAESIASEHIATFLGMQSLTGLNLRTDMPFYLGEGFYTYTLEDEKIIQNNVIVFPVIQQNQIVLLLGISNEDGIWSGGANYNYIDQLNEFIQTGVSPAIIFEKD